MNADRNVSEDFADERTPVPEHVESSEAMAVAQKIHLGKHEMCTGKKLFRSDPN